MDKKYAKNGKTKAFLKRNMYYIIMGVCILAIGAMITVALLTQDKTPVPDPVQNDPIPDPAGNDPDPVDNNPEEPVPTPIVFRLPVANEANVQMDYVMDTVVWWSTLKVYRVHNGIDFAGAETDTAVAAYKGVVRKVEYDALNGHYVEIDHGNGLVTYYGSLSEPAVAVGQQVEAGTVLGNLSTSATAEMKLGPHVHFAVYKDGKVVSPYDYLPEGDK